MGIIKLAPLGSGFTFLFAAVASLAIGTAACGSDDVTVQGTNDGGSVGQGEGGTTPGPGGGDGGGGGGGGDATKPGTCDLAEITGATAVAATFAIYEPPGTVPAPTTGGTLSGKFKITKAKVYLPTNTKGLADPAGSTGNVTGWASFDGKKYRIKVDAKLTIKSVLGDRPQDIGVNSQGEFTVAADALTVDQACDNPKSTTDVDYKFTAAGTTATLVVKTPVEGFGDAYLEIEASSN